MERPAKGRVVPIIVAKNFYKERRKGMFCQIGLDFFFCQRIFWQHVEDSLSRY